MGDYNLKIVLIGNSNVGKSSFLNTLANGIFNEKIQNTIGVDFFNISLDIDNENHRINIWDTAGQEKFYSITRLYYHNSHCILLMFDLTNRSSFTRIEFWCNEIREKNGKNAFIILIGNKCDKKKNYIVVNKQEIENIQKRLNLPYYFNLSAKYEKSVLIDFLKHIVVLTKKHNFLQKDYYEDIIISSGPEKKGCCIKN